MRKHPHSDLTQDKERGAALVEFALVAPIFLLLIFSAIEAGLMLFTQTTMQYALREGMRYAIVDHGVRGSDPNYDSVLQTIKDGSMGFYNRLHPVYEITVDGRKTTYTNPASFSQGMFGTRGNLVQVKLSLSWPLITPLVQGVLGMREYRFEVATTTQNEKE